MNNNTRWVTVSWMPHASLSQTSHVAVTVKSIIITSNDDNNNSHKNINTTTYGVQQQQQQQFEDWQVQVTVHGVAGLPLVPVPSFTPMAPLITSKNRKMNRNRNNTTRNRNRNDDKDDEFLLQQSTSIATTMLPPSTTTTTNRYPSSISDMYDDENDSNSNWTASVSNATHSCRWDSLVQIPIRWRDLPRDAYIHFVITKSSSSSSSSSRSNSKPPVRTYDTSCDMYICQIVFRRSLSFHRIPS
jgi:hypothetical protein